MENERMATLESVQKAQGDDLKEIKADVKSLLAFKWQIFGITGTVSFIISTLTAIAYELLR